MNTIKHMGEMYAYLPDYYSPDTLQTADCIGKLMLWVGESPYAKEQGYPLVGMATVTVEVLIDEKGLISAKVEALRAKLQKERADAEVRCNAILEQISRLEALEWNGSAS